MGNVGVEKLDRQVQSGNQVAVVFVHGFTGDRRRTWRRIPEFLQAEPMLAGWDLIFFGYSSHWLFDLLNLWSADPGIEEIATKLATTPELAPYKQLAFVAHSMGGLAVQRALVKSPDLVKRTRHVILFGTPSGGLNKARAFSFWKQQIKNMAVNGGKSKFIADLRADWTGLGFGQNPPFTFLAVAGLEDQFVPPGSSLEPFPARFHAAIDGNHLTMLQAESANALCVQTIVSQLTAGGALGPRSAARLAVQHGEFQDVISRLWPNRNQLDDKGAVDLALALDSENRRDDAIKVLEEHTRKGTDVLGVLAGRYKRCWIAESRRSDFDKAVGLYRKGFGEATAKQPPDDAQAFYHGINLAYLALAGEVRSEAEARQLAEAVLEHCRGVGDPKQKLWRLASEGDACIILKRASDALQKHQQAAGHPMDPWQALSIQEQTLRLADLMGWSRQDMETLSGFYQGKMQ
jgi:pimeloyl-ACP methyl ester carboxylesterase